MRKDGAEIDIDVHKESKTQPTINTNLDISFTLIEDHLGMINTYLTSGESVELCWSVTLIMLTESCIEKLL